MEKNISKSDKRNKLNQDDINEELSFIKENLIRTYLKKNCSTEQIPLKNFIKSVERELVVKALRISNGSQRVASFVLGMKPTTLNEKIKKFRIDEFKKKPKKLTLKQVLDEIDVKSI